MRRGEIAGLTRRQVDLSGRIITLTPGDTKEGNWKRVPIHRDLVPILEQAMKIRSLEGERVFLVRDQIGARAPGKETIKNCWPRALAAIDRELKKRAEGGEDVEPWPKPWPRFHDLRRTWKRNARRPGMRVEIEMAIMGHSARKMGVHERYDLLSDEDLLRAIDDVTFDHGRTQIWVAK